MSKVKNAQMEENALEAASFALDHIEAELRKDNPNWSNLKIMSDVYNALKPYF